MTLESGLVTKVRIAPSEVANMDFAKGMALWEKFVEDYTKEKEAEREFQLNLAKYIVNSLAIKG